MQMLVPRYLEASIESLTREQEKFRQQIAQAFGTGAFGSLGPLEDQVRRNMEMFQRAFTMFTPFAKREGQGNNDAPPRPAGASGGGADEIDDLKRQMEEMQKRLDRLGNKDTG
jgi:polyhydroxyalkanoate synthesis regulator protein